MKNTIKKQFRGILTIDGEFHSCDFGGHENLINLLIKIYEYYCYSPYNIFKNNTELRSSFIYFNYYEHKNEIQFDNCFIDFSNNQLAWLMREFSNFDSIIQDKILSKIKEINNNVKN